MEDKAIKNKERLAAATEAFQARLKENEATIAELNEYAEAQAVPSSPAGVEYIAELEEMARRGVTS